MVVIDIFMFLAYLVQDENGKEKEHGNDDF